MHKALFWTYLVLAFVGLVTAWIFNGIAVLNNEDYLGAWFGTAVDWVLSADLTIVAFAVVVFMISEARRLGMKHLGGCRSNGSGLHDWCDGWANHPHR